MIEVSWKDAPGEGMDFEDLPPGAFFYDKDDDGDVAPHGYKTFDGDIVWFHKDQLAVVPHDSTVVFPNCVPIPNMKITLKEIK